MNYVEKCCKTREQFDAELAARRITDGSNQVVETPAGVHWRHGTTGKMLACWINEGTSNGVQVGGHGVFYG